MKREMMKDVLAWMFTFNLYLGIELVWKLLEKLFYGQVTPRVVDTIIGALIIFLIRITMNNVVDKLEVKYLKSFF